MSPNWLCEEYKLWIWMLQSCVLCDTGETWIEDNEFCLWRGSFDTKDFYSIWCTNVEEGLVKHLQLNMLKNDTEKLEYFAAVCLHCKIEAVWVLHNSDKQIIIYRMNCNSSISSCKYG